MSDANQSPNKGPKEHHHFLKVLVIAVVLVLVAFWILSAFASLIAVVVKIAIIVLALVGAWHLLHRQEKRSS
jgi:Flp pilus assembly protein TadB